MLKLSPAGASIGKGVIYFRGRSTGTISYPPKCGKEPAEKSPPSTLTTSISYNLLTSLDWLAKAEPDVVSLQELKAEQDAFPVDALRSLGYEAVWQGGAP